MASPYVGEIRAVAFDFVPLDWAACNGALIPISENETLFNLIGTTYGGDGQTTFALPNLLGRIPIHWGSDGLGNTYELGEVAGSETVTLNLNQIPSHTHAPQCSTDPGTAAGPQAQTWAACSLNQYSAAVPSIAMAGASTMTGGSQPHNNLMPYLAINFIISLFGIFPSQN